MSLTCDTTHWCEIQEEEEKKPCILVASIFCFYKVQRSLSRCSDLNHVVYGRNNVMLAFSHYYFIRIFTQGKRRRKLLSCVGIDCQSSTYPIRPTRAAEVKKILKELNVAWIAKVSTFLQPMLLANPHYY